MHSMSACNVPSVNGESDCKVLVESKYWLAKIQGPFVEICNAPEISNRCLQLFAEATKPFIFVPENSLEQLRAAGVLEKQQADRIVVYYETEAGIRHAIENSSQGINGKIRKRCVARNLLSILNGKKIASVLYKDGPIDSSALNDGLNEIEQRIKQKRRFASSAPIDASPVSDVNEEYWHSQQLSRNSTSCRFCQGAVCYEHHAVNSTISITHTSTATLPPTPTGVSPRGDYSIDELI